MEQVCEVCQSSMIDYEYLEQFGVFVCLNCKEKDNNYTIITKTQAKSEFLLTDEELQDSEVLPSISRKNPHNPRWADMKLYLRLQVRNFAIKKFGSEEALKQALTERTGNRTDRKSKQFLKKLKELRSKTKVEKKVNLSTPKNHSHQFVAGECTICGLKVLQEEL